MTAAATPAASWVGASATSKKDSDVHVVIQNDAQHTSTTPGNPLQKYLPALREIMAAPRDSRPAQSHALLDPDFTTAWAAAANTASFQAAQRAERDRVYWNPAWAAATKDHLSLLGRYLYYDIFVNHGPGDSPNSFGGIIAE